MKNEINQAISAEQLQIENSKLKEENASLQNENVELLAKLNWFEEHFRLNQHRLYGRSSEQTVHSEQQTLFNEAEVLDAVKPAVPEPTIVYQVGCQKKHPGKHGINPDI